MGEGVVSQRAEELRNENTVRNNELNGKVKKSNLVKKSEIKLTRLFSRLMYIIQQAFKNKQTSELCASPTTREIHTESDLVDC